MTAPPASREPIADRMARAAGRWWRRAKYQWLNASLLTDVAIAVGLFAGAFLATLALPAMPAPPGTGTAVFLAVIASLPPLLMLGGFWHVRSYLKDELAYEDLRSGERPSLARPFELLLRFPCSAVVLFALLAGVALAAWGAGVRRCGRAFGAFGNAGRAGV